MNRHEIMFDRKKKALYLIPPIVFSLLALMFLFVMIMAATECITKGEKTTDLLILMSMFLPLLTILFYGTVFVGFRARKTIKKMPAFVLDENGITNYSTLKFLNFGFIPWSQITSIESYRTGEAGYTLIKIKDSEKFISSKNFILRYLLKRNKIYKDATIVIPTIFLEGHFTPVNEKIKSFWEKYR